MLYYNVLYIEWFWDSELIYALGHAVVNQPRKKPVFMEDTNEEGISHADVAWFLRIYQ